MLISISKLNNNSYGHGDHEYTCEPSGNAADDEEVYDEEVYDGVAYGGRGGVYSSDHGSSLLGNGCGDRGAPGDWMVMQMHYQVI